MTRIRVGTRESRLSMRQTEEVLEQLTTHHPDIEYEIVPIKSSGDLAPETPLVGMGRGIFVKELERALLDGQIDIAVHSLKDMPTQLPDGLAIGAVGRRADPRDALVDRWGSPLSELPRGARIGTSSPRRAAQLKEARPDVEAVSIRGNVETRVRKAEGDGYDGAILALAGLERLGLGQHVSEVLSPHDFVPAPGQGALAVEVRQGDPVTDLVACLDHGPTRHAVNAERAFLESLGGGCQLPMGAYGQVDGDLLSLTVFLADAEGGRVWRTDVTGPLGNPQELGMEAYLKLVDQGAKAFLRT